MTPTVNLLPPRYAERLRERRLAGLVVAALLVLLALFVLGYFAQSRQLRQAENGHDLEQARNAELKDRRQELAPFGELATDVVNRERVLSAALRTEVSWARVLTSLARSFPADASLTSLTVETKLPAFDPAPPLGPGGEEAVIGATTMKGYSVQQFTPGLERALQLLAEVVGLSEPRLQVGTVEEVDGRRVTTFEGSTFVDGAALTGRYADGLPPEDDVDVPPIGGSGLPAAGPAASTGTKAPS